MAVTRINNNQITDASAGNVYVGINAGTKLQAYSITAGKIANNLTYGSDLTVAGNLTVQGTSTAIDTTITTIEDPVIILASTQTGAPSVDIGFLGERGSSDNIAFVWDESQSEFVTVFTSTSETNTTVTISSYANFHTNDANIGGNIVINGTTSYIGNITGNLNVTGNIAGGNLLTPGLISAAGNITGSNLSAGSGTIVTTGNIDGNNLNATTSVTSGDTISAVGNITGGNLITSNLLQTGTLETTGNALIGGNLIVQGNITYINIDDLRVEDPIIILGTGPNGAPLTVDDGKDRGIYMEYYTTGLGNAYMGWQNSSGNIVIANDVVFSANDVVQVNAYGTLEVGNIYAQSASVIGNVTANGMTANDSLTVGGAITGVNVQGGTGSISASGNIVAGNISTAGSVTATTVNGGNIVISGDDITDTNGRVNFNTAGDDVDFAVNGDTVANVFYIDAGTGTASFGSETQTTDVLVAFNTPTSILAPVGNTSQRPATGVTGMLRFNTTDNNLELYDNTQWTAVGVPVFTLIADEQFNGDGSTVAFTLGSTQTTSSCIVSINGVVQIPTIAYSVAGTDPSCVLTFTEAPAQGDIIDVRELTTTTTVTSIANTGGNAVVAVSPTLAQINITGNVVPVSNVAFNLGSPTNFWNELYLSGNSIYLGDIILKANNGNLLVRNFDDSADAAVEATFISTSTTSGNLQIGLNHIEAINANGNIELRPNGNGRTWLSSGNGLAIGSAANVFLHMQGDAFHIDNNSSTGNIVLVGNTQSSFDALKVLASGGVCFSGDLVPISTVNGNFGNLIGNVGNSTYRFAGMYANTVYATATSAQYADLAEKYVADAEYAPGTVLSFGGNVEVTLSTADADRKVAGVVSTNPSYIMNSECAGEFVATVALTGRVPTQVVGTVRKGDLMVSAGNGKARAEADPKVGTVIGKALEDSNGDAIIEVVVGRF